MLRFIREKIKQRSLSDSGWEKVADGTIDGWRYEVYVRRGEARPLMDVVACRGDIEVGPDYVIIRRHGSLAMKLGNGSLIVLYGNNVVLSSVVCSDASFIVDRVDVQRELNIVLNRDSRVAVRVLNLNSARLRIISSGLSIVSANVVTACGEEVSIDLVKTHMLVNAMLIDAFCTVLLRESKLDILIQRLTPRANLTIRSTTI